MVRRSARIETKLTPKLWSREEDDDDYERPELRTPEYSQRENIHRSPFGPRIEDKLRILGLRSTRRADLEQTDRSRFFSRLKHLSGDLEASRRKEEERRIDSDVELRSLEVLDEDNDGPVFYSFGDLASREDEYGYLNGENASDDDSTVSPEEEHFEGSPSPVQQQVSPPGSNQRGPAAYHVIKSLYAGDGYEGGHHSAKLTAVLSDRAVISQSMFRWIHFARSSMDIDDFSAQVALIPGLSSAETAGLRSMIASIKRDNVLKVQVSDGKYVRRLEPRLRYEPLTVNGKVIDSRTITWVSLPYFTLQPYSGLLGGKSTPGFPTPTLLQLRDPRTSRNRDMQQAVCQQRGVPNSYCFHVSQLWCLILDNSLLLTYGSLTEDALCEGIIDRAIKPLPSPRVSMPEKTLLVRFMGVITWSIPVQECQTWFSFVSHFRYYRPRRLRFYHYSTVVRPAKWHKLYRIAIHPEKQLVLDLHLSVPPKLPQPELLLGSGAGEETAQAYQHAANPAANAHQQTIKQSAHLVPLPVKQGRAQSASHLPSPRGSCGIFAYLESLAKSVKGLTPSPARPSLFRDKTLGEYFINLEHQILHKTSLGDGSAYRATEAMERSAVHKLLESERQRLYETYSPKQQRDFNRRVALFLLADAVFNFFFPQDMLGITTSGKFWGAVARLVMPESSETPEANATLSDSKKSNVAEVPRPSWRSNLDLLESFLGALREDIFAFTEIFASIEEPDREYIKTPPTLTNAWVHIILALATFPHNQERSLQLADRARSEVNDGMGEIIAARSEPLDVCNLVMLPSDMVALMCLKLTDNPTPNMPHIFSVYGSYLRMIESEIDTAPDRKIEIKLRLLRQELGAIRSVVVVTANDVHFIATKRSEPTSWFSVRLPADGTMESMAEGILGPDRYGNPNPCGFSYILLRDCLSELRAMVYELSRTTEAVERLSTVNRERIGETKDRQERAIYAFTMVTVVFLPLSAVASIFGMNSSDIRDMELGQWAYWATALPVTAAVMVLGLLVTGDLEVAHRWFEQRISRPRGKVTWETDSGEK